MAAADKPTTHSRLSFIPFTTFIDPVFWNDVNRLKVNEWKLDESPKEIHANFTIHGAQPSDSLLCFDQDSLAQTTSTENAATANYSSGFCTMKGTFLLLNTKKAFAEDLDRRKLLEDFAQSLWKIITEKQWLEHPELLNSFYLTAFADVKNFAYFFWNCLPALVFPDNIRQTQQQEQNDLINTYHAIAFEHSSKNGHQPFLLLDDKRPAKLTELVSLNSPEQFLLVFPNPSDVEGRFGWPLRNLLAAVAQMRPDWTSLRVLALSRLPEHSFVANIQWDPVHPILDQQPRCVGWERTSDDKLTFRSVDLKFMFDPIKIMEQSVDLNLKLIRWRQAPSIDLDRFTSLRVLMVGSGTLGCNIARALLGWGCRNFTFVDHSTVSYNNPIRQSLFAFDDCHHSGSNPKAEAAAAALKRIYPLVNARGLHMKVPMPGYPYSEREEQQVRDQVNQLEECIRECDVLFLVMDSRESRWLPTLLAAVHNKLALTVALGFDDFVIIRHGANPPTAEKPTPSGSNEPPFGIGSELPGSQLGCYFCNDVTAPGNSTSERALDQQCTISRSGISMIASGFATELLASILQHKMGAEAPAKLLELDENATLLGATPHQIRGFVSRFHQMTPTVRRFERCTACGQTVQTLYRTEGFAFLDRVFKDPSELERLTGLTELQQQANEFQAEMIELDDNESVSSV